MKRLLPVVFAGLVLGGIWHLSDRESGDESSAGAPPVSASDGARDGARVLPDGVTMAPVAEYADAELNRKDGGIEGDLDVLESVLGYYAKVFEQHPVGLNHEIVGHLVGRNARRVALISPSHPAINRKGELVDRWGTPFFFHQISASQMEVISAGPDGQLWTHDDVKRGG